MSFNPVPDDSALPSSGRLICDSRTQLCYWVPALQRYSDRQVWEQRGWQALSADDKLLLALLGTLAPLILVNSPDLPSALLFAQKQDIEFATNVPVALALLWPGDSPLVQDGSDIVVLADDSPLPPEPFGTLGAILSPESHGFSLRAEQLSAEEKKPYLRLRMQLAYIRQATETGMGVIQHWNLLHRCAQQLASAYWSCYQHKQDTRFLASSPAPVPASPLLPKHPTSVPLFNEQGITRAIMPPPLLSVVTALDNLARGGEQWTSGGVPTFSHKVGPHQTLIMLKTTSAVLSNDVTTQAFWELHHGPTQAPPMERFKVLDADVALLLVLLNMSLPKEADGSIWIWPAHFLAARNLASKKPKAAPNELHSIRTADKEAIVASLERLTLLHLAGKTVVQRKRVDILEGPFFQVEQRWLYWIKSAERPRPSLMAERIRMGHWIDPFLRSGLQTQMGIYIQKVLSYDPYHEPWEKGLGHYFMFNLYLVSAAGYRTLTISVGELLDACSLPVDPLHPYQALLAFTRAMDQLDRDNVIADWDYEDDFDPEQLPSKDWLRIWRRQRVTVAVGSLLMEHGYQEMIQRMETRRLRRQQRLQQASQLLDAAQKPHEGQC